LKNYEKKSFIGIFLGYFISVAIFILLLGFLYFEQQKSFIIQKTAMNMYQYMTKLKYSDFKFKQKGYSYNIDKTSHIKIHLPQKIGKFYIKTFSKHIVIKLDANIVDDEVRKLKNFTFYSQFLLILIFAIISFILAKKSLQPMIEAVLHLDRFTKDLIHDLNTPITSILLNTKMLKKHSSKEDTKKINRIENSAKNISLLYANLEILLDENNLQKTKFNLAVLINETIQTYQLLYPNIRFDFKNQEIMINSNINALKRIIDNIISNSCKYSIEKNPKIDIEYKNNTLTIIDNGKGIKYPKKIFQRSYKELDSGHGIGMHIVYRLCSQLSIKIDIKSYKNQGTSVALTFY
jgi:two-component system OmpR family sensor kinase